MTKLNKKQKDFKKNLIGIMNENLINNKIKYDFYEVIAEEDVDIINDTEEIIFTLKQGDTLLRVGENLVSYKMPLSISSNINYRPLLKHGFIKQITDEKLKLIYTNLFQEIINDISIKVTSQFLTDFDSIYEFIKIPKELQKHFLININALCK